MLVEAESTIAPTLGQIVPAQGTGPQYEADPDPFPTDTELAKATAARRLAQLSMPDACTGCHDKQLEVVDYGLTAGRRPVRLLNAIEERMGCSHANQQQWGGMIMAAVIDNTL